MRTFLTFTWKKLYVKCLRQTVNLPISWHLWIMVRQFLAYMAWYAATSFSFYQHTAKQKAVRFLETLKNRIYWKIIIITSAIIWSLKFKTKTMEKVLLCGITNSNIKQNYYASILTYFLRIMNNGHKIISVHRALL